MLRFLRGAACVCFIAVVLAAVGVGGFIGVTLHHFGRDLPNLEQLAHYVPATGSKVYAADGALMAEFESERRIPVAIEKVPPLVIRAFLAAEDRDFYNHKGVDPSAIFRAAMSDVLRLHRGQRPIGASTITQQVVRHFLLTNEVSIARKVKEALLAYRIEHTLSKDRILEIYLNEIYFGVGAYGVGAAADTYFQKPLDKLSLAEIAFLAALPKAPNNYNPLRHADAARARRDWVIAGMADIGWVPQSEAKAAMAEPLGVHLRSDPPPPEQSGYFAEEVRRELIGRFGEKAVYEGGLRVRTSYTANYQKMSETAFRNGLVEYDRRHGWRGALAHYGTAAEAEKALGALAEPPGMASWQPAAVTGLDPGGATIALKEGGHGHIPITEMRWARRTGKDQRLGPGVRRAGDVVAPGDIVLVEPLAAAAPVKGKRAAAAPAFGLRQIPEVSGGLVVMDPKTGRVLAMVGGWSYRQSQFNRATQAMRQPGSSFKPFVYVTALENGFTPYSTVDDSPIDIPQGAGQPGWQPVNYEGGYVGQTTLEDALVHSRNLATVHVAMTIGLPAIATTVQEFGIMDKMPLYYSMALGAGETTLMRLTGAYAMLDNGGHWLLPSVIDSVQDRSGHVVYQKGVGDCAGCFVAVSRGEASAAGGLYRAAGPADPAKSPVPNAAFADNAVLYKPTVRDPLVTPEADAAIVQMMQGVVQRGTGVAVAAVGKPLAGKTGTTSDWFDAWFVGFSPDLTAGVFVGFDEPRTLGGGEVGGHVAAPIFRDFMMAALKDKPATEFPQVPHAAPVVASVERAPSRTPDSYAADPYAANPDAGDRDDGGTEADDVRGYGPDMPRPRQARRSPYAEPGAPYVPWQGYPAPPRDYAAAGMAPFPTPWGAYAPAPANNAYYPPAASGYAAPAYGAPYSNYNLPRYPSPGRSARPGFGTGGLY